MPSPAAPRRIRFGRFELDARTGELMKGGTRLRVPDQSIRILEALLERAGDVVTREELRDRLWPAGTFVDFEHGLNSALRRLREALDDSADNPKLIETLPRRGYRFIGTVEAAGVVVPKAAPVWQLPFDEALKRRDIGAAVGVLQARLAEAPDPEARMALGKLLLVADPAMARQTLEHCVQEFIDAGLRRRAAVAAAAVAASYTSGDGNRVAAEPWLQRAWRLVRDEGRCVECGWVAIFDIACNTDDPQVIRERCDMALEMARLFRDVALEAKALADGGYALTALGDVAEGTAQMDEALAIVTSGQLFDPVVTAEILCAFFASIALTGDLGRGEAWNRVLRERGLIGAGAHAITTSHCDSVYGGLLYKLGRFNEAESVLTRAMDDARGTIYAGRLHPLSSLAELRIQQGRFSEAEELLRGHDDFLESLIPRASLYLARGSFDLAAAAAQRCLRLIGADRTRAVSLLGILVEAELGRGNLAAARTACARLDERVADTRLPALCAEAARVRARVRVADGDRAGAIAELEAALDVCAPLQIGPLSARIHLALARLHGDTAPGAALVEARAAAAILTRLDVIVPHDDLAFLRSVGAWPDQAADGNTRHLES